ncbi:MAG: hypothetical protein V1717_02775 [Candidatus Micrarchaeota archaeon]
MQLLKKRISTLPYEHAKVVARAVGVDLGGVELNPETVQMLTERIHDKAVGIAATSELKAISGLAPKEFAQAIAEIIEGKRPYQFRGYYDRREFESYYNAVRTAYERIAENPPDLIIANLRGGLPLIRSIQLIASLERNSGRMPKIVFIKTGAVTKAGEQLFWEYNLTRGLTQPEKRRIVKEIFDKHVKPVLMENPNARITVIDEAVSGGSIRALISNIDRLLQEGRFSNARITSLAIKSGEGGIHYPQHLKEGLTVLPVAKLFTIDTHPFHYPLVIEEKTRGALRSVPKTKFDPTGFWGMQRLLDDIQRMHLERMKKLRQRRSR